jgi:hypothetical protein
MYVCMYVCMYVFNMSTGKHVSAHMDMAIIMYNKTAGATATHFCTVIYI